MALPNLTRDQAVERAALVTVDSYRIHLDLTDGAGGPGEHTFSSVTTVEFDALPGADSYLDLAADTVRGATLNGHPIDVSGYDESTGIPLRGLSAYSTRGKTNPATLVVGYAGLADNQVAAAVAALRQAWRL